MKSITKCNDQLKLGYNLQIATENRYILTYDLFSNLTDTKNLNLFLDRFSEQHSELLYYITGNLRFSY